LPVGGFFFKYGHFGIH